MLPTEEDVFIKVHGSQDLWTHVLDFLPYENLWVASSTSHCHLEFLQLMRNAFTRLSVRLHDGLQRPSFMNMILLSEGGPPVRTDRLPSGPRLLDRMPRALWNIYPSLTQLHVAIALGKPAGEDEQSNDGIELLFPDLLQLKLPKLRVLQLSAQLWLSLEVRQRLSMGRTPWPTLPSIPNLALLGRKFPSLTALNVSDASVVSAGEFMRPYASKISLENLEGLLMSAPGIRHLDLSGSFAGKDFGPGLSVLARHAPHLRSLAVYGVGADSARFLEFAYGCPLLETLHWVAWDMSQTEWDMCLGHEAEILSFLRACPHLTYVDVSSGFLWQEHWLTWLEERQQLGSPVKRLVLNDSYLASPEHDVYVQQEEVLLATQSGMRALKKFKELALVINPASEISIGFNSSVTWPNFVDAEGIPMLPEDLEPDTYELNRPRQGLFEAIGLSTSAGHPTEHHIDLA